MSIVLFLFLTAQGETKQAGEKQTIEHQVVYQKETTMELKGANVEGDLKLPSSFPMAQNEDAKAASFLNERTQFKLGDSNPLGY